MPSASALDLDTLPARLRAWGKELGFADVGISRMRLDEDARYLRNWLEQGFHGEMAYMARTPEIRSTPSRLHPGTVSVISVRMDHLPPAAEAQKILDDGSKAYIARYALGRDYHRLLRGRLKKLAERLRRELKPFGYRVFADSAPSLEKALARDAGLGWIGKNTLLLNKSAGSFFLLGEIYCDLSLPVDEKPTPRSHCGSCQACMDICPTKAIVGPRQLDARRCISYLTIENRGAIPVEFRKAIGNRIFGCDDCQLVCPWNRYAKLSTEPDFAPRHGLDSAQLVDLLAWTEDEYLKKTEGMALRRAGYRGWLRNIAVALGNAPRSPEIKRALRTRANDPDELVREHVAWAIQQQLVPTA